VRATQQRRALLAGIFLTIMCGEHPALGQEQPSRITPPVPAPSTPEDHVKGPPVVSDAVLDQIRRALSSEATLGIRDTNLRFYVEVHAKQRTFADYVKGSDLRAAPARMVTAHDMFGMGGGGGGGGGLDLVGLVQRGIEALRDAKREHDARQIRRRIEQELLALSGAK